MIKFGSPWSDKGNHNAALARCINVALAEVGVFVARRDVETKYEPTSLHDALGVLSCEVDSHEAESPHLLAVGQALDFSLALLVNAVQRLVQLQRVGSYIAEPLAAAYWRQSAGSHKQAQTVEQP